MILQSIVAKCLLIYQVLIIYIREFIMKNQNKGGFE